MSIVETRYLAHIKDKNKLIDELEGIFSWMDTETFARETPVEVLSEIFYTIYGHYTESAFSTKISVANQLKDYVMLMKQTREDVSDADIPKVHPIANLGKALESKSTFSVNLTNLCKDSDIRITTIAVHLGVSAKLVEKWTTGICEPTLAQFRKICELFNVSADKLLW